MSGVWRWVVTHKKITFGIAVALLILTILALKVWAAAVAGAAALAAGAAATRERKQIEKINTTAQQEVRAERAAEIEKRVTAGELATKAEQAAREKAGKVDWDKQDVLPSARLRDREP